MALVYVNAEGKANTDAQLRVIVDSVKTRHGASWLLVGIREADFCSSLETVTHVLDGYTVRQIPIENGRAAKLLWNRGCQEFSRGVEALNRSFRVDLDVSSILPSTMKPFSTFSVVISHLAHGDAWWDSADDLCSLLSTAPSNGQKYALGDCNVEGRVDKQRDDAKDKWMHLVGALDAYNIVACLPTDDQATTGHVRFVPRAEFYRPLFCSSDVVSRSGCFMRGKYRRPRLERLEIKYS